MRKGGKEGEKIYLVLNCFLTIASAHHPEEAENTDEGDQKGMATPAQPPVSLVTADIDPLSSGQEPLSGPQILSRLKEKTRVVRGQDWKWAEQVCECACE